MLKRWGIENNFDVVIFLSLILLVAIAPLGSEATHPIVLGLYRTLLVLILLASTIRTRQYDLPQVCFLFLGAAAIVVLAMYGSVVLRSGSHFEGHLHLLSKCTVPRGVCQPGQLSPDAELTVEGRHSGACCRHRPRCIWRGHGF